MRHKKPLKLLPLVITGLFTLSFLSSAAQNPHKRKVMAYNPKYTATTENLYWVDKDTLYVCAQFDGTKIALADIDLTEKNIKKSNLLVDGTNDNIYALILKPKKQQMSYVCQCVSGEIIGTPKPSQQAVTLMEVSNERAEFEFNKLKLDALNPGAPHNDADSTAVKPDPGTPSEPDSPSVAADDEFDSQLLTLMNGMKDRYESLKGKPRQGGGFDATVQLKGAASTYINIGMMHNASLVVDFGEFASLEGALPVYHKFADKIEADKKLPTRMIKQPEDVADISRTITWIPFDVEGKLDASMKRLKLTIELTKTSKTDKDYNHKDVYFVAISFE